MRRDSKLDRKEKLAKEFVKYVHRYGPLEAISFFFADNPDVSIEDVVEALEEMTNTNYS